MELQELVERINQWKLRQSGQLPPIEESEFSGQQAEDIGIEEEAPVEAPVEPMVQTPDQEIQQEVHEKPIKLLAIQRWYNKMRIKRKKKRMKKNLK